MLVWVKVHVVTEVHVTKRLPSVVLLLVTALVTCACTSPSAIDYIPEGDSYGADDLVEALESSDPGQSASVDTQDAAEVRQDALTNLRRNGEDASMIADILTSEFPVDVAAVPYRVELGEYDGTRAWIVFEAWGEAEGQLASRRLWVFSYEDGSLLTAQSLP